MIIYSAQETAAALPFSKLADEIATLLRRSRSGAVAEPLRSVHQLSNGNQLLLMTAWDDELGVVKRVGVYPGNPGRGLPTIRAELLVFDARTGEGLLLADGGEVTARRTAALSLLAANTLHPDPLQSVLLIGAGRQAATHAAAFIEARRPRRLFVYNRTLSRAGELARTARELGVAAQTVPHPQRVATRVDCIISATSSRFPVVPEEVATDACVIAVGAYTPEMAELPPVLVQNGAVVVDTLAGARAEAGDLIQANVDWNRVVDLASALDEPPRKRPAVFKSVGSALFDLAAAHLLARQGT